MKQWIKRISYKLLVMSMITVVLSFFSISSVSEAKLKLQDGEFYYTGTQEGTYKPPSNFWKNLLKMLGEIANYLLGIMTLGLRGVIVGWIEIMEILLTAIVGVKMDIGSFFSEAISGMDSYSQYIVNVEKIIFNRVPILHANIFLEGDVADASSGNKEAKQMKANSNEVVEIIRNSIAKWYYVMRLIVIAFMLLLLLFIGIKMALSTIASEKALYKQMLIDWIAGMIIVFSMHYIMIFILNINDSIIEALQPLSKEKQTMQETYQYGDEAKQKTGSEIETTLYESARTRAYSLKLTDGFTGMVIYAVLVYYAWKFALIYFRRMINVVILTLLAPAVAASYAFNKVMTGKSKIFSTWFSEYIMNIIIQIVHVVVYVSFVSIALTLSLVSITGTILAFVLLNFMAKADKLIRQIFKLSGGSGSLSGEMADRTGFRELKQEALGMKEAMMGGAIAGKAMKATYGAVGKVAGAVGMATLSNTVAFVENRKLAKAEKEAEQKTQEEKDKEEEEKLKRTPEYKDAQKYLENDPEAIKNLQRIEELEEKQHLYHSKLTQEQIDELKAEGIGPDDAEYKQALNNYGISESEQKKEQREQEKIAKEIKKIEDDLQKGFLTHQVANGGSIKRTVKGNLGLALRGLVELENGKYKSKKVSTIREGGVNYAFWRKATDSKALRFRKNMKLGKLFSLDSGEEKVLKAEMNFWKNRITALGSLVAGTPLAVVNPMVGMALLSKSAITHLDVRARKRRYRNRVAKLHANTEYTFKAFGEGATKRLSRPETYHVLESDQLEVLKHKKVRKEVSSVIAWAKSQEIQEGNIKDKVIELEKLYADNMYTYEGQIKTDALNKSIEDLAFEQKVSEKNVVNVGNGICMQLQNNIGMKRVLDNIKDINARSDLSSAQKVKMIQDLMAKNKSLIITEAITTLCEQKGITDIKGLQLTDAEIFQINQQISNMVEKQGVVKKGELDLQEAEIDEKSISEVYLELNANREQTNKVLEENIVSLAILEYMQRKGEKNPENLQTEEAQQAIFDLIKGKLMSKASKESASVIEKLMGQDKVKEDFELSEDIKNSVEENIKRVKKVKKEELTKQAKNEGKEILVEREVNRKLNETKYKLEKALYTQKESDLQEKELELLFILSNLGDKNAQLDKMGVKVENRKKNRETAEKLNYYEQNDGSKKFNESKDGSRRFDESRDGSKRVSSDISDLDVKIHGPVVDIIDLINNVSKK